MPIYTLTIQIKADVEADDVETAQQAALDDLAEVLDVSEVLVVDSATVVECEEMPELEGSPDDDGYSEYLSDYNDHQFNGYDFGWSQ